MRADTERPQLTRTAIARTAIEIADREGLAAVTIRRIATQNGVTATALYWYFRDKEALLDGIAEEFFTRVQLPKDDCRPWQEQLRAILEAYLRVIAPHPATAELTAVRVLRSDAGRVLAERVLRLLGDAGLAPDRAANIGSYLLCAVVALITAQPAVAPQDTDGTEARATWAMLAALPPDRFPTLIALAPSLAACVSPEQHYADGLNLLIDGVSATATRR